MAKVETVWTQAQVTPDELHDVFLDDGDPVEAQGRKSTRPQCLQSIFHEISLVLVAAFIGATFLVLQRGTVVITKSIKETLSMDASGTSWITASSGLTAGAFLLPLSQIIDRCPNASRKTLLLGSVLVFAVLVGLTALSENGIFLNTMNALTGIAASANIAIMGSLLCSVYTTPSPRRNVIITMFLAGGNSVGVIFGGIGSGLVATGWNWRASFVYMAIVFVLVAVVGFFAIPNLPGPYQVQRECPSESSDDEKAGSNTGGMKTPPRKIDWLGLLFGLQGVGCISAALTIAPEDGWGRPWVVVLLIYGAMSLFGFFAWENYTSTPMVPRMVWSNRKMILVLMSTFCAAMGYFSCLFWVPLFMQDVQGLSPLDVAIRLLPQAVTGLVLSPMIGCYMHKIDNSVTLAAAAVLQVVSSVLLVFLRQGSNYFMFAFPSLILSTLSMDWTSNVASQFILHAIPVDYQAVVAAILQSTTRLAIPVGLGATTAVWSTYSNPGHANTSQLPNMEQPYIRAFEVTIGYAVIALLLSPFTNVGKLVVASTIDYNSSPALSFSTSADAGPLDSNNEAQGLLAPRNATKGKRLSQLIQPRSSSLMANNWRRKSAAQSSHLSDIAAEDGAVDDDDNDDDDDGPLGSRGRLSKRTSTLMGAKRVIWLVCEDCGSSKRIVEPVGDPVRYFYDGDSATTVGVAETLDVSGGGMRAKKRFSLGKGMDGSCS